MIGMVDVVVGAAVDGRLGGGDSLQVVVEEEN